jgi:hypothetical protein
MFSASTRLGCQDSGAGQLLSGTISRTDCALSGTAARATKTFQTLCMLISSPLICEQDFSELDLLRLNFIDNIREFATLLFHFLEIFRSHTPPTAIMIGALRVYKYRPRRKLRSLQSKVAECAIRDDFQKE